MIEFEILNTSTTPPGGWYYRQPESGREFKHYSYNTWLDQIRSHRIGNNYPISADFEREMQDQLVRLHPEWVHAGIASRIKRGFKMRRFSFSSTVSFLKMLYKWIKDGRPFVSQEEAERRAILCVSCPYNQQLTFGCGGCYSTVMDLIAMTIGDRKTNNDENLGSCGICSCSLKAAVHFPLDAQQQTLSDDIKEDFKTIEWCWKKEGLE